MAAKKNSKSVPAKVTKDSTAKAMAKTPGKKVLSQEELALVQMYRHISQWEKNALFLLLQSVAWGSMESDRTDSLNWPQMRKMLGMGKVAA